MRASLVVAFLFAVFLAACNDPGAPGLPAPKPPTKASADAAAAAETAAESQNSANSKVPEPKNELAPKPRKPRYRSHWPVRNRGPQPNIFASASITMVTTVAPDVLQGYTTPVTFTGTGFTTVNDIIGSTGVAFSNIVLVSSTEITADASVAVTADIGDQTWTLDMAGGFDTAQAYVVPPTDVLPVTDDTEPSRNPAVAGVNTLLANGEFFTSATDLATRGRMMGIHWSRFYSSNNVYNGPLGFGWMGYYFQRAIYDAGDITWYAPNGRTEVFVGSSGVWDAPAGVYITASYNGGSGEVTLVDRHGFTCVFNSDGRLASCTDRNGNSTTCNYNVDGQLDAVTDDRGFEYEISYYDHGRVETVTDKVWSTGSPRVIEYSYDGNGDLTSFKAPETARYNDSDSNRTEYQYTYDGAHRLLTCKNPHQVENAGDPYLTNTYDANGRIIQQQLGTSGQNIYLRYHSSTVVREVDRRELRTDYTIDGSGRATAVKRFNHYWSVDTTNPIDHTTITKTSGTDVRGSSGDDDWTTSLTYNSNNEVTSVTYPRGNKATYAYPNGSSQTSGTADSCSNQTLTKSGAGWGANAWAGMFLRMGSTASTYRYYPIVSNTSTTITVGAGFDLDADGWGASDYAVYNQSPDPRARGNVLSVTRSDEGLGALSDIVSSYTYEPRYQFVKTAKDPRNNVSTYTYDYEAVSPATDEGNLIEVHTPTITIYPTNFSGTTTQNIVTYMEYNAYGQVTETTDGAGNVTEFSYYNSGDRNGFLFQRIVDPGMGNLNLTTEFDYNRAGLTIAMWPPRAFDGGVTKDDFKTSYEVNELNQTWHVTGRKLFSGQNDRAESYSYFDLNGNLTQQFNEYVTWDGNEPSAPGDAHDPTTFSKSSSAMAATWIEATHTYGLLNQRLTTVVDAIAGMAVTRFTTTFNYDDNYNQIRTITPLTFEHETVFDERELVFKRIAAEGAGAGIEGVFRSDYDDNGNLSASFDALSNQTTFVYDGFDRQTKVTDPELHYRETDYDAASNVTETRAYDYNGGGSPILLAQTQYTLDEINRVNKVRRLAKDRTGTNIGDGWSDSFTALDMNSRAAATKDDNGVIFTTTYDEANRVDTTTDGAGNIVEYTYNSDGAVTRTDYDDYNQVTTGTEASHTESTLDFLNRTLKFRDQRYNVSTRDTEVEYAYDSFGRTVKTTDADGTITLSYFDLLSRMFRNDRYPTVGLSGDSVITQYGYDSDSRNTTRTIFNDGNSMSVPQTTTYNYDARGRLIEIIRDDSDDWDFTYDAQNRTGWTDPLGTTVEDTFDDRNLVTQREISRGSGVKGVTKEQYTYDGLRRITMGRNYENIASVDELHTECEWAYNTLSLPESHTQDMEDGWGKTRTFTTYATHDAAGFNRTITYDSGRVLEFTPDGLNRVAAIDDNTHSIADLATFKYGGKSRLIKREYSNGIVTTVDYEAAGCGCGGFSAYCEKIKHADAGGNILFQEERRFDVNGNPTAARWEHEGNYGEVYRYDDSYRLTNVYEGVGLQSTALATYANPANTPSTFRLVRNYSLDTRGNRTTVEMEDDSSGTITSDSYSPDAETNVYDTINSQGYTYDLAENQTYDPTTGLYKAYDYLGRLVAEDLDSDLASPEKRYRYDVHSRMRVEEFNFDASFHNERTKFVGCMTIDPAAGTNAGCGCTSPGSITEHEEIADAGDNTVCFVEFTHGVMIDSGGSSKETRSSWDAAPVLPGGNANGNGVIAQTTILPGPEYEWQFCFENQQRSLLGAANIDGFRDLEVDYNEHGLAYQKAILWDGRDPEYFAEINLDTEEEMVVVELSTVGTAAAPLSMAMEGALARVVTPNQSPYVYLGRVTNVDLVNDEFSIEDPNGDLYTALTTYNGILTVFDLHDSTINGGETHLAGIWDAAPSYSSGSTTLTAASGVLPGNLVGSYVQPDAHFPVYFQITGATSSTITVAGDITSQTADEEYYCIIRAPGVSKDGTLNTGAQNQYIRHLAFGYSYMPPLAGMNVVDHPDEVEDGTYGRQEEGNFSGQYYCWHRFYAPETGRWTAPDPAQSPFYSLISYVDARPTTKSDPAGFAPWQGKATVTSEYDEREGFTDGLSNELIVETELAQSRMAEGKQASVPSWLMPLIMQEIGLDHAEFPLTIQYDTGQVCNRVSIYAHSLSLSGGRLSLDMMIHDEITTPWYSVDDLPDDDGFGTNLKLWGERVLQKHRDNQITEAKRQAIKSGKSLSAANAGVVYSYSAKVQFYTRLVSWEGSYSGLVHYSLTGMYLCHCPHRIFFKTKRITDFVSVRGLVWHGVVRGARVNSTIEFRVE